MTFRCAAQRLAVIFLLISSCSSREEEQTDWTVGFTSPDTYVIDASTTTCLAFHDYAVAVEACRSGVAQCDSPPAFPISGLNGPYANLGNLKMQWSRPESLRLIYLRFTFRSSSLSGGKYEYNLADRELWATWRLGPVWDPLVNPRLPNPADTVANGVIDPTLSMCEVSIPISGIANKNLSTGFSGVVLAYGVYRDQDSRLIPIFARGEGIVAKWLGTPP